MNTAEIEGLEERLRLAMLTSDVPQLDQLISSRLMFVGPGGELVGKADDLQAHRSGAIRLSSLAVLERKIELFDSFAIVNVAMTMEGSFHSSAFAGRFRYTRVWYREDGLIRVVAGQVCTIQ